jgi:hypothetical protein
VQTARDQKIRFRVEDRPKAKKKKKLSSLLPLETKAKRKKFQEEGDKTSSVFSFYC